MRTETWKSIVALGCLMALVLAPAPVWAQEQAGITGTVVDETALPLPGVAVVVTSPSLIGEGRTAVTDGAGIYQITALPNGTYTVTFTLQGFSSQVREDVVLTGSFMAPVNAALTVGALTETLTVTAASPLVDVVSTRRQTVLTAERVNVLPGAAGIFTAAQYVPGVTRGGLQNDLPMIHGSDPLDGQPSLDGVRTGKQLQGRNEWTSGVGLVTNEVIVTEVVFDTASQSAEYAQSGMRTNVVPKSGGNTFAYNFFATGTRARFQSDNQSQALKDRGFRFAPTAYRYSYAPAVGGPILQDKLWFFASFLDSKSKSYALDTFFKADEPSTPKGLGSDLRAFTERGAKQQTLRITHQLTQRNKITYNLMHASNGGTSATLAFGPVSPEAFYTYDLNPAWIASARWTAPVTNRLLFEADFSWQRADVNTGHQDHGDGVFRMAKRDIATGRNYHTTFQNYHNSDYHRRGNASLSYVTGSHNFKAGFMWVDNYMARRFTPPGQITRGYFLNGEPDYITVGVNGNSSSRLDMNCDCGIYVQDSWTLDRLTLNGGFRYDQLVSSVPGGTRPAGFFAPEITLSDPIATDVPNWKNFNGRFGGAFDLFGDGSTAVKFSGGRYVENMGFGIANPFNPLSAFSSDRREWIDVNGDNTAVNPDGTPQLNEIGLSNNPNFGLPRISTSLDPDARRGTNWEYSAGIERQLRPGWSVSGMWHRRSYGHFRWTQNLNTSAANWMLAGTWTGPTDPRLPASAQGVQVPIYVTDPDLRIVGGNSYITNASDDTRTWNGFEVILDGELPRGGFMTGSITMGKEITHRCTRATLERPNSLRFCNNSTPYRPMGKLSGALPLPFDTMISGLFQVFSGADLGASYTISRADFPGLTNLGNSLSRNPTLGINLIEPNTEFEDYRTQTNIRFSKVMTLRDMRTRIYVDTTNIFNQARITGRNRFFGGGGVINPLFNRLLRIEAGRRLTFGLQMYF